MYAKTPIFRDPLGESLDLVVKFDHLDFEVPFTARADDPEPHGRDLYARAMAGEFGEVAAYVAPVVSKAEIEAGILAQLAALDMKSIRPLREADAARLAAINAEADALRVQLAAVK